MRRRSVAIERGGPYAQAETAVERLFAGQAFRGKAISG
jgi:hypothetical protein